MSRVGDSCGGDAEGLEAAKTHYLEGTSFHEASFAVNPDDAENLFNWGLSFASLGRLHFKCGIGADPVDTVAFVMSAVER
jgi:hypothetical protein